MPEKREEVEEEKEEGGVEPGSAVARVCEVDAPSCLFIPAADGVARGCHGNPLLL